ncbi:hypothetical protein MKW94_015396, partial [Papaver nudicaule]|nr:hypothetical protein [Papaver nudicaule]
SRSQNNRGSMSPRLRSMSPVRQSGMPDHRTNSRSPARHGRSFSRSNFPDGNRMRIRRGRGFTDRYAFVRKYRTPSPVRFHPSSFQNRGRNAQNMNPD